VVAWTVSFPLILFAQLSFYVWPFSEMSWASRLDLQVCKDRLNCFAQIKPNFLTECETAKNQTYEYNIIKQCWNTKLDRLNQANIQCKLKKLIANRLD
jgi:hypothetical protein